MNKLVDKLFKGIDYFTGILTGLMVFFVFLNVVLRTFFNAGLTWSEELARYLFVYVTYIGAISAMRANAHLGVDTLISRMKPQVQMVMYIVSQTIIAILMIILVWGSEKMVAQNTASRTAALGIPYSVLYFAGIITGVAIAIMAVINIVHALKNPSEISEIVTMSTSDDDEIAAEADFFCFGTNDLTQMTFGFSRDDAGKFLNAYYDNKIFENDPFAKLDQTGVGKLMETAIKLGKPVNPNLHVGICGEHGGDPSSVEFCHKIGLDYVSCSPFRVPIARLAAAQAAIAEQAK